MANDIIDMIPPTPQQTKMSQSDAKRVIAKVMREAGETELFVSAMETKMPYMRYLAIMLWDAVTMGEFYLADGRKIQITEFGDWLDLVKFMAQHVDGPAVIENNFIGNNIYKIYQGIDDSKV
jgi:hypothetical protein